MTDSELPASPRTNMIPLYIKSCYHAYQLLIHQPLCHSKFEPHLPSLRSYSDCETGKKVTPSWQLSGVQSNKVPGDELCLHDIYLHPLVSNINLVVEIETTFPSLATPPEHQLRTESKFTKQFN